MSAATCRVELCLSVLKETVPLTVAENQHEAYGWLDLNKTWSHIGQGPPNFSMPKLHKWRYLTALLWEGVIEKNWVTKTIVMCISLSGAESVQNHNHTWPQGKICNDHAKNITDGRTLVKVFDILIDWMWFLLGWPGLTVRRVWLKM